MADVYHTLWTYPWDLTDAGPEAVVRCLREEIGLDGMSLASAYHTFNMLRPHSRGKLLLQIPQSAVYFQPRADLYRDTPIKPHVSPLMGAADWYADAAEACAKAGLDLIAWTVFLHNSYLAGKHPGCAQVACTGDISTANLCPANPDVRAFAVALSRDLVQNYGIAVLECESLAFGGFGHAHYHLKHGVDPGQGGRFLLALCFCDACREKARKAGLDPDILAQTAESHVREALGSGRPLRETPDELCTTVPQLARYVRMREDTVTTLVQSVREAAGVPISFIFMGDRPTSGADRKRIAEGVDYTEILSYTADPGQTRQAVSRLLPDLRSPDQLLVGLQAYPPASPNAETLQANVEGAAGLGIRRFSYYNYGIMPPPNLDWVRKAIGAARKTLAS